MESLFDEADEWVIASDRGDEPPPPNFTIPIELYTNDSKILVSTPSLPIHDIISSRSDNNVNNNNGQNSSNSPWIELRGTPSTDTPTSSESTTTTDTVHHSSISYGWYAKQTIPAGTRLLVAKPIAMVMDWEDDDDDNEEEGGADNEDMIGSDDKGNGDAEFDEYGAYDEYKINEEDEQEDDTEAEDDDENDHGDELDEDDEVTAAMQTSGDLGLMNADDTTENLLRVEIDDEDDDNDDDDDDVDDEEEEEEEEEDQVAGGIQNKGYGEDESEPKLNQLLLVQILEKLIIQPDLWTLQLSYLYPRTDSDVARLPTWVCHDDTLFMQVEQLTQQLEDKAYYGPNNKQIVQQIAKRLPLIIRYNILSIETCCELLSYPGPGGHSDLAGVGLYCLPSFFNHSRTPNCTRWSVGDVMVFVTNQSIPANSELCISYIEHDILCENAYRRNSMLRMDFHDSDKPTDIISGDSDDSKVTVKINTDTGPDMPVVDPDVQNELMSMDPYERLQSIDELLKRASGYRNNDDGTVEDKSMSVMMINGDDSNANMSLVPVAGGASTEGDTATTEDITTTAMILNNNYSLHGSNNNNTDDGSGEWFQCDIQNLRILKAITFDGLGQHEQAMQIWDESIQFLNINVPPNDENLIVLHTQAALCSYYIYHKQQRQTNARTITSIDRDLMNGDSDSSLVDKFQAKAHDHASRAVQIHNILFGGGVKFFRRRMRRDLELALRPKIILSSDGFGIAQSSSPTDILWPIQD